MPPSTAQRTPRRTRGEGQWALGYREPLNKNEENKKNDDGLNVRQRIIDIYSRQGFDSIDPADLRGRFRWWGLYTQRRPGIDGGKTATLEPEELDDEFFMLRVRIPGGALRADQLRVIAGIATEFGRDFADDAEKLPGCVIHPGGTGDQDDGVAEPADQAAARLGDLFTLIVRVLSEADEHAAGELEAALDELSRSRARDGFTPSDTALGVFSLKEAVYELVADSAEMVPEFLTFSRVIDDLGLRTFEAYSAAREQIISDQVTTMMELSTPVVQLWDGIIAVPLVGTLDSARTQLVMEKLLDTLVATGADHAVIDITGVATVDTEVAQHLLKTVSAARLLGAECTISGIRPQVAQTIVSLGIEFGDIATKATLADALALALRQAGLKVVPS